MCMIYIHFSHLIMNAWALNIADHESHICHRNIDPFGFIIIKYPHSIAFHIQEKPAYGAYASCIISFPRACDHCHDFSERPFHYVNLPFDIVLKMALSVNNFVILLINLKLFVKYSKSFKDIKKDIPFAAIVIKLQFITISVHSFWKWEMMEGWVPIKALTSHMSPKSHVS